MTDQNPSVLRRALGVPAQIVVALYLILDAIVGPLFRPLMRWLSGLRLIQRVEHAVAGLPPYVILALLVVPFGFAELAKVYALLLMAEDHFRSGMTIFIGAYIVSILVCERTFQAGKGQLMTIGWFKRLFDWVMALKERILSWFRQTRVWTLADDMRHKGRQLVNRVQSAFGGKPKSVLRD